MIFSDPTNKSGIVEQSRALARVDSTQWPIEYVANSVNNYLNRIFNYGHSLHKKFNFDDSNHTKLPIGTTNLVSGQSDYSFLVDEQGNRITNVTRIEIDGRKLLEMDERDRQFAMSTYSTPAGKPIEYDKIADNIIRLYPTPDSSISNGITFYFTREPSYFSVADTTKSPGVPTSLHRGFVANAAYDIAVALGLQNSAFLAKEVEREWQEVVREFKVRTIGDSMDTLAPEQIDSF